MSPRGGGELHSASLPIGARKAGVRDGWKDEHPPLKASAWKLHMPAPRAFHTPCDFEGRDSALVPWGLREQTTEETADPINATKPGTWWCRGRA